MSCTQESHHGNNSMAKGGLCDNDGCPVITLHMRDKKENTVCAQEESSSPGEKKVVCGPGFDGCLLHINVSCWAALHIILCTIM